jgi:hypothetical protein
MMRKCVPSVLRVWLLATIAVAGALVPELHAEPAAAKLLSSVSVSERDACAVIKIEFNSRVQYVSHMPLTGGDELRITLKPIDQRQAVPAGAVEQESLHAPANGRASVHAIELGRDAGGAALNLYFKHKVAYKIALDAGFKSILIAIPGPEPKASCVPGTGGTDISENSRASGALEPSQSPPRGTAHNGDGLTPEMLDVSMKGAREALPQGDVDRAITLLIQVLAAPGTRYAQEARELLGVAREKKGLIADAKADYQAYLALFPKGPGPDRVRARLAVIDQGGQTLFDQLKKSQTDAAVRIPPPIGEGKLKPGIAAASSANWGQDHVQPQNGAQEKKDPAAFTITQNGSTSLYYNRNQGGRDFFVPPRLQLGWDKENVYQLYQNNVFGTLAYEGRFDNSDFTGRVHVSASQDNRYITGQNDETAVSALYFDGKAKESGVSGRVGRQTVYSGGVLGRFDGVSASYQIDKSIKFNAVTGSPVERSRDTPFLNDSYFYGISADFDHWREGVDTSLYFIDQRTDGLVDRQGIGTELRYSDEAMSGFATVDYDIHYLELNEAVVTGTYIFPGFSTLGINVDYRRAPLIFTSNALQGQGAASLTELLKKYTHDDIEHLALDRTAKSYSAGANVSHPLNEHLLLSGDVTLTYMSGTPGSGSVAAAPSTGVDFYSSVQLTQSDAFTTGDSYTGGLRFADSQTAFRYMLEGSARYPVTKDWRLGPVLRLGYIDSKSDGRGEYEFMPSLRSSYYIYDDLVFEVDVGKRWTARETEHGTANETELTVLSGIRYDFHTGN